MELILESCCKGSLLQSSPVMCFPEYSAASTHTWATVLSFGLWLLRSTKQKLNLGTMQVRGQGEFCCEKERDWEGDQGLCSIGVIAPDMMGRMRAANALAAARRTISMNQLQYPCWGEHCPHQLDLLGSL